MTISFHPLAERELHDASHYYELESPGLADAFLIEVERSCAAIAEYPNAGFALNDVIRRRLLRRFPYGLLYSVKQDSIRILAVMNLRRRPTYWHGRS